MAPSRSSPGGGIGGLGDRRERGGFGRRRRHRHSVLADDGRGLLQGRAATAAGAVARPAGLGPGAAERHGRRCVMARIGQPLRRALPIAAGGTRPARRNNLEPDCSRIATRHAGRPASADGIDVAVHAPDAEAVAICLFDSNDRETARFRLPARTGPVVHGHIPGVAAGTRYGLRAYGPRDPANGPRFNPSKLLMDPWAHHHRPAIPPGSAAVLTAKPRAPRGYRRAGAQGDRRPPRRRAGRQPPRVRLEPPGRLRAACSWLHHDPPGHPARRSAGRSPAWATRPASAIWFGWASRRWN